MKDKISIIVPVYNVEKYLSECVDSIVGQAYQNMEVILVDDGSTDGSGAICDRFALTDNRIIVIHQKNRGISASRNAALQIADGDYIGFVDSDDVIHPQMYQWLIEAMKKTDTDVAICHELAFFKDTCDFSRMDSYHIESIEDKRQVFSHFMDNWAGPVNFVWNKLYKRKLWDGVHFKENTKMEDMYIQPELMSRVKRVVWIKEALYGYRQRQGSIMNSSKDDVYRFWAAAQWHQREIVAQSELTELKNPMDVYTFKILAGLQCMAQKAGMQELRKEVYESYTGKLYPSIVYRQCSVKDRILIAAAYHCWPVYYWYKQLKGIK